MYEFLNVTGKGHYVGTVLSVVQAEAGWFGEGDDFFWVDGEKYPSIEGTGSEDYFNDAWGLHEDDGPYYGVTVAEGTDLGSRMTAYRWHVLDPIPFTKSLKVEIEHKGWTYNDDGAVKSAFGERTDLMSSVAFWYQEGIAQDQPPVPYGSARLPQGNAQQIEVEKSIGRGEGRRGQGLDFAGAFLVQGRHSLQGRRQRLEDRDSLRRARGRRLRDLHRGRPGFGLRRLHGAARRQGARGRSTRTRAGRRSASANCSSTATRSRRSSASLIKWAGRI